MSLRSQLPTMLKDAMKARDQVRLDTIRFLMAQAKNLEIDLKRELNDDEFLKMLKTEVKNRIDAIDQFKAGGREDIVAEEEAKLLIIKEFMPAEMSEADLEALVNRIVAGVEDKSNFGLLMKAVMAEVAATQAQVDGKRVAFAVKKALS